MNHFGLLQHEFLLYSDDDMSKVARQPEGQGTLKNFLEDVGQKEVTNPSPKGKKRTIKVISLRSGDDRQKQLFTQLYKQWKGSGSISSIQKEHKLREKVKGREDEIRSLRDKLKEQQRSQKEKETGLTREIKQLRKEFEIAKKKMERPEKVKPVEKETTEPVEKKAPEPIEKDQKKELESGKEQQAVMKEQQKRLEAVGDKSNKRYDETIATVKKNQDRLYRDAAGLSDPSPPDPKKIESINNDQKSLQRAIEALDISNSEVSDVVNSPNVVTYKVSLKSLSDKDKAKAMRKLLSTESKTVLSHFIGKKENVTVSENRDTDTIDVHVPKGTELKDRDSVSFKELITNDKFVQDAKDPTKLPIAFGKDDNNEVVTYDFSKTPHLIVSGATKSGKSVFMQSIINSVQMSKSPEDVKMVLIDVGKSGAEFAQYKDSAYLAQPIADTAKKAEESLKSLGDEVNRRNKFLKDMSTTTGRSFKNIEQWNEFVSKKPEDMDDSERKAYESIPEDKRKKMSRMVCIVDEAKDLFNKDVNPNAHKIYNLVDHMLTVARSVGAHMVISTQSPALQNIPGKLQANIGAKMTFRLQNKHDAENIGVPDATDLLMYGDGYFEDPARGGGPTRLQTGFISDSDDSKINEQTKGKQTFIEREKRPEVPSAAGPAPEFDKEFAEFKSRIQQTKDRLEEQRKKIEERIKEFERTDEGSEKAKSELRQKQQQSEARARQLKEEQQGIKQREQSPEEETTTAVEGEEPEPPEPREEKSPDVASEIEEMTKTVPVSEVKKKKEPEVKVEETKPKPTTKIESKRESLRDKLKRFLEWDRSRKSH